jgi:hypothetical protein
MDRSRRDIVDHALIASSFFGLSLAPWPRLNTHACQGPGCEHKLYSSAGVFRVKSDLLTRFQHCGQARSTAYALGEKKARSEA